MSYFEIENELFKKLYESYPNIDSFKNDLAKSYYKLAQQHILNMSISLSRSFFQKAEQLWLELVEANPQDIQFKEHLEAVKKVLEKL